MQLQCSPTVWSVAGGGVRLEGSARSRARSEGLSTVPSFAARGPCDWVGLRTELGGPEGERRLSRPKTLIRSTTSRYEPITQKGYSC